MALKSTFIIRGHDDFVALPDGNASMTGVLSFEEAYEKAKTLKEQGIDFVELCGAFNAEIARGLTEAAGGDIPFGYIVHLPEQDELFSQLWRPGKKTSFAFVIMGHEGRACFKDGITNIVGVKNMEDAIIKAKELCEEGIECIEVCGAFGPEGAKTLIDATGGKMGVGYIVNLPEQGPMLAKLFGGK